MAAEVAVRFTPDSRCDFQDRLVFLTQLGRLEVPLIGRRPPPALTLPEVVEAGHALVGNTRRVRVPFVNEGGDGRFRLVPEALWPPPPRDGGDSGGGLAAEAAARAALDPFWLEPRELDVPAGAAGSLALEFVPHGAGLAERAFVLACDNGRMRRYTVRGRGTDVDVRLEGVDGRPMAAAVLGCTAGATSAGRPAPDAEAGVEGGRTGGPPPLWLGKVVPGAAAELDFCIRNATPLPLPFRWEIDSGGDGGGGGGQPGSGAAAAAATAFTMQPARGVLQPGELVRVTARFEAPAVGAASALARLLVDRAASARRTGVVPPGEEERDAAAAAALGAISMLSAEAQHGGSSSCGGGSGWAEDLVEVASVRLQGAGSPASLDIEPQVLHVRGALVPGECALLPLEIRNPTGAPVAFQFDAPAELGDAGVGSLAVAPSGGVVPPRGAVGARVLLRAPAAGPLRRELRCAVRHGPALALTVGAEVAEARVAFGSANPSADLDFGLVQIGHSTARELLLVNTSEFGPADWTIEQLVSGARGQEGDGADSSGLDDGGTGTTTALPLAPASAGAMLHEGQRQPAQQLLQLEPASGELPASGTSAVRVSCAAAVPGHHRLVLRLRSGRHTHAACVEARVTVVVPDVSVTPCRCAAKRQ
jgi:hypothetical protein